MNLARRSFGIANDFRIFFLTFLSHFLKHSSWISFLRKKIFLRQCNIEWEMTMKTNVIAVDTVSTNSIFLIFRIPSSAQCLTVPVISALWGRRITKSSKPAWATEWVPGQPELTSPLNKKESPYYWGISIAAERPASLRNHSPDD